MCSLSQISIIFESSRPSRQSLYFNRGYGMLPLTWPGKWKEQEGAPASLNVSFDICMASATYAPTLGLAESVRLTSGSKEPGLVAELRSLGCKSTTMPPAINWSQELANLRQEIADPLVPVHPDLPGLATRHTPPDDQDAHEDQHLIMRCWHANASGLRAKVEGQLARETLLQWVPVMQDCLSLLSLPLSLQAGEIRLTQGNFGNQIVDFADRAMRLRCCNQREAWHMLTMPAAAMAGALSQLCTPVLRLSEHQALDLSWYQLAKPQIWLWLLLDEIEALTPSIASVMNAAPKSVLVVSSWRRSWAKGMARPLAMPHFPTAHFYTLAPSSRSAARFWRSVRALAFQDPFPVQEAVGARLIQAFEQGRVMVHIPAFCPDQFTHPKAHTGCLRLFLPVATSALGLSFRMWLPFNFLACCPTPYDMLKSKLRP